jgi:hypothetical protein
MSGVDPGTGLRSGRVRVPFIFLLHSLTPRVADASIAQIQGDRSMMYLDTSGYRRISADDCSASGSAGSGPAVELSREAVRLLLALKAVRAIRALPSRYPHVLNKLAGLWDTAAEAERYLAELLLTSRSGRQGFPSDVVNELMFLRGRNAKRLPPVKQDVWLEAMLR